MSAGHLVCAGRDYPPILEMCWSFGRIVNVVTGTLTRRLRTCSSAATSAPGAMSAPRTSCTESARTAAANSSGALSGRPRSSWRIRRPPAGWSDPAAP